MSISRLQAGPRAIALEIAAEARAEWGFATDIIARTFRAHRELASGARRLIAETVYGLIRMDRRLDAIVDELGTGERGARGVPLSPLVRDELKLLVHEARSGVPVEALAIDVKRLVREPFDLSRAIADDAGLGGRTGLDREATRLSYPTWLLEAWVADYGAAEATALAEAMNQRAPMAIRVNTTRIGRDTLIAQLAEEHVIARPSPLSPVGLVFETRINVFGLSAFRDGLFEVMDEGSQLVAELVAPPPGGRVVDACAGAGGKTLALSAALAGKGRVLALDTDGKKLEELRRRARRAGLTNVHAKPRRGGRGRGRQGGAGDARSRPGRRAVLGAGDAAPQPRGALAADPRRGRRVPRAAALAAGRLRAAYRRGRPPDLRHLHREPPRERGRRRTLPRRARRLRPRPRQGDLGPRARGEAGRRHDPAAVSPPSRHRRLLRRGLAPRALASPGDVARAPSAVAPSLMLALRAAGGCPGRRRGRARAGAGPGGRARSAKIRCTST